MQWRFTPRRAFHAAADGPGVDPLTPWPAENFNRLRSAHHLDVCGLDEESLRSKSIGADLVQSQKKNQTERPEATRGTVRCSGANLGLGKRRGVPMNGGMIQNVSKVLVIDDAAAVVELLARFFARAKLHPVIASNGIVGVQQAQALLPSLIFCDANMPGLNGLQVIERLRAEPATARIPIVLISGYEAARFHGSGADAFLQKPFLMTEMLALARRFITRPASGSGDKTLGCAGPAEPQPREEVFIKSLPVWLPARP